MSMSKAWDGFGAPEIKPSTISGEDVPAVIMPGQLSKLQ